MSARPEKHPMRVLLFAVETEVVLICSLVALQYISNQLYIHYMRELRYDDVDVVFVFYF